MCPLTDVFDVLLYEPRAAAVQFRSGLVRSCQFRSVQFRSGLVRSGQFKMVYNYALGKAHMRSTPPLESSGPPNVAFKTFALINSLLYVQQIITEKQFQCWSDWLLRA